MFSKISFQFAGKNYLLNKSLKAQCAQHSEYQTQLPIVCIIGVATSTEFVHQSLTKLTINMLRIERFKLENSDVWFNKVIEKVR